MVVYHVLTVLCGVVAEEDDPCAAMPAALVSRATVVIGAVVDEFVAVARDSYEAFRLPNAARSRSRSRSRSSSDAAPGGDSPAEARSPPSNQAAANADAGGKKRKRAASVVGEDMSLVLHNDDVHTYHDVTSALQQVCGKSASDATTLTAAVDREGQALAMSGPMKALVKPMRQLRERGLLVSLQPKSLAQRHAAMSSACHWLQQVAGVSSGMRRLVARALARPEVEALALFDPYHVGSDPKPQYLRLASQMVQRLLGKSSTSSTAADSTVAVTGTKAGSSPGVGAGAGAGAGPDTGADAGGGGADEDVTMHSGTALDVLLRLDAFLPKQLAIDLHAAYMSFMTDTLFRHQFMGAFSRTYAGRALEYARGVGTTENSLSEFSVQLFTSPTLVERASREDNLLSSAIAALAAGLGLADPTATGTVALDSNVIIHERWVHVWPCAWLVRLDGSSHVSRSSRAVPWCPWQVQVRDTRPGLHRTPSRLSRAPCVLSAPGEVLGTLAGPGPGVCACGCECVVVWLRVCVVCVRACCVFVPCVGVGCRAVSSHAWPSHAWLSLAGHGSARA